MSWQMCCDKRFLGKRINTFKCVVGKDYLAACGHVKCVVGNGYLPVC